MCCGWKANQDRAWFDAAMALDIKKDLDSGALVEVLPNYQLPKFKLYAVTLKKEQQPAKITRCLTVLEEYFAKLS